MTNYHHWVSRYEPHWLIYPVAKFKNNIRLRYYSLLFVLLHKVHIETLYLNYFFSYEDRCKLCFDLFTVGYLMF